MKLSILVLLLSLSFSSAYAEKGGYGMAGCGLGAIVMGNKGGQISAATTNGTGFNQGFAITSGTSECLEPGQMAQVQAQQDFVATNLEELSKEMAKGEGQYLEAFSQTLGCSSEAYPAFASHMKSSYGKIFRAPGAMATLKAVRTEIKSHDVLKKQCDTVI